MGGRSLLSDPLRNPLVLSEGSDTGAFIKVNTTITDDINSLCTIRHIIFLGPV